MSLIQAPGPSTDPNQRDSPGLTANLPSNNPFRNRNASPASSPITTSFNIPPIAPERPTSRNPFLDQQERRELSTSPDTMSYPMARRPSSKKPALTGHAAELFDNLTLNHGPASKPNPPPYIDRPPRSENFPPDPRNGWPGHQPSRSQEDDKHDKHRGRPAPRPRGNKIDIFADPPKAERPRIRPTRRNSDSSIASKALSPEDRRHRHRQPRRADGTSKPPNASKTKPNRKLDIIDSLDVTSIHGIGMFHHDGPFDACNPHRNRKGSLRAPIQAFAKDSANNAIGGSGPVNKDINFAQFHGRGEEGFTDFATSGAVKTEEPLGDLATYESYAGASAPVRTGPEVQAGINRTSSFNPKANVDPVHGVESLGLGTSTFLEGAPAARTAIQRRESNSEVLANGAGLGRKLSLAQKIRGISNSNRGNAFARPSGRVTSPEGVYDRAMSPLGPGEVYSAGGLHKITESNPFFNDYDYDDAYERKGRIIQQAEQRQGTGSIGGGQDRSNARARAMSSPKRPETAGMLERRVTNDGAINGPAEASGGGFLSRVKSLKGGKRTRPERRDY